MKIKASRKGGFTLVEIMIVVAIIGLLASVAIPNFVKARTTAQTTACISNLQQLEGAINQWALINKKGNGDAVTLEDIKNGQFIKLDANGDIPHCPGGGQYSVTTVDAPPTCSKPGHVLP
jgi:prepilin-type N-terminal cleavage/methylation domain-containing protein